MNRDTYLRYRPKKGLKLNYQITYNIVGENKGKNIFDSKLEIGLTCKVIDYSREEIVSVLFTVDRSSLKSNNLEKNAPLPGEEVLLVFSSDGKLIDREGNIPWGFVDFLHYSFPSEAIQIGSMWNSPCHVIFPNMKNPLEVAGKFKFERAEGYKGYNCSHISYSFLPRTITLPSAVQQTLSGYGYILFDSSYSISPFTCITTVCDTGAAGLIFRGTFKQEIGPFVNINKNIQASVPISQSDEYFTRY